MFGGWLTKIFAEKSPYPPYITPRPKAELKQFVHKLGEQGLLSRVKMAKHLTRRFDNADFDRIKFTSTEREVLIKVLNSFTLPLAYQRWTEKCNRQFLQECKQDSDLRQRIKSWRKGYAGTEEIRSIIEYVLRKRLQAFSGDGHIFVETPIEWEAPLGKGAGAQFYPWAMDDPSRDQRDSTMVIHTQAKNGKNFKPRWTLMCALHEQTHSIQAQLEHAYKWRYLPKEHPAYKGGQFHFVMLARVGPLNGTNLAQRQPMEKEAWNMGWTLSFILNMQAAPKIIRVPMTIVASMAMKHPEQAPDIF